MEPIKTEAEMRQFKEIVKILEPLVTEYSFHIVVSLLLKYLLAALIKEFGPEEAVVRLSSAVNECIADLKKEKLI